MVTDSSSGAIADATLTLTNTATNAERLLATNSEASTTPPCFHQELVDLYQQDRLQSRGSQKALKPRVAPPTMPSRLNSSSGSEEDSPY